MTNAPSGAAADAARDPYYVYRPFLDLIGSTEGIRKGPPRQRLGATTGPVSVWIADGLI
jgi:hypothetical protein